MELARIHIPRVRQLLELMLSSTAYTARQLAVNLSVTPRTVARDIQWLRDFCGYKIEYQHANARYVVNIEDRPHEIGLGLAEVLGLYLSAEALGRLGDDYHMQLVKNVCNVLQSQHQAKIQVDLTKLAQPITFALSQTAPIKSSFLQPITSAINSNTSLSIHYDSVRSGRSTWRIINPLHLHCRFGTWYLIGWCHTRKETLLFRTDRISEVKATSKVFKPSNFDIEEYLAGSLQVFRGTDPINVELRVRGLSIRWFNERKFHSSQTIAPLANTEYSQVRLCVVHGPDLENWILSWGEEVEVVGPKELREAIAKRTRKMWERYGGG